MARNKTDYTTRAMKFIAQIAPYVEKCYDESTYKMAVARYNRDHHRKVRVASGLTRVALITSDYVIKFNYGEFVTCYGGCEQEMDVYAQAEYDGFEYLFAKITKIIYQGKNYYIMPRIYGVGRTEYDVYEYLNEDESDWLDEHVRDLHNYNYGWKNGHPVIIDYACTQ